MAKRQVTAIVRIQLPAGKATPAPPVGTASGASRHPDDGVREAVQRGDRGQGGPGDPGRGHDLLGPELQLCA